jgi:hypothetical protein
MICLTVELRQPSMPTLADDVSIVMAAKEVAEALPGDSEQIQNELLQHLRKTKDQSPPPEADSGENLGDTEMALDLGLLSKMKTGRSSKEKKELANVDRF